MNDFKAVNRKGGSKIRISASPCHGSVELYVKPGLNFNGEPMNQMFETIPNTEGMRTPTWPFPNNITGNFPQGPEAHMMEPGWEYPGPMFKEMLWGFNSAEFGKENVVTTKILHGSYFVSVYGAEDRLDANNFTLSVSMIENLSEDKAIENEKMKEEKAKRFTSMKTDKIDGAHGEFLLVQWDAPSTPRLTYPPGDFSYQVDMNSFDQYQVFWATDSQTFYDFERPNEEGWGFDLLPNGAIRHPFLEEAPGFCYWPDANLTNTTGGEGNMVGGLNLSPAASAMGVDGKPSKEMPFDPNATVPGPVNTNCIMDTECGIRGNGVPAYIKVKRNWELEAKGLALIREICTAVLDEVSGAEIEECIANPTAKTEVRNPDAKAKEFVRYEMHVNRHGEGVTEGEECGRTEYTFAGDGLYNRSNGVKCEKGMATRKVSVNGHVNADYCDRGIRKIGTRCKPGLQCQYKLLDNRYRCQKTYFRPDTAKPKDTELFIRTRVPHDCWKTGEEYCHKGTKIINVPPVERRVRLEIFNNKYTERWQPWNPAWVTKYMDAPNNPTCRSSKVSGQLECTWQLKPGEVANEEYEFKHQQYYTTWKALCETSCKVDMSFLIAPLRIRIPEIEMIEDGSQSTRFGLDGIIHASKEELNGKPQDLNAEKNRVKLYSSLEEGFTAVFTAHGIASAVDAVSDSDVLVLQSRCDIELTASSDLVSAEKALYTIPMGPMPCSEPFICTFMHWRSREVKVNVMRRKCVRIMKDPLLGYKCAQFMQIRELYSGTKGNTTYDQESQGAKDNTIMMIGITVSIVLAGFVAVIMFMKVRTSLRLSKAYEHVDKHLAGQPASIDKRRQKEHLLHRAKTEKGQKKQAELWDKKSKLIKENIQKKKDEFRRRMKAIKKENQRREHDLKSKIAFEAKEKKQMEDRRKKIAEQRILISKKKAEMEYNKLLAQRL